MITKERSFRCAKNRDLPALKIASPDLTYKTESGGVKLSLKKYC